MDGVLIENPTKMDGLGPPISGNPHLSIDRRSSLLMNLVRATTRSLPFAVSCPEILLRHVVLKNLQLKEISS